MGANSKRATDWRHAVALAALAANLVACAGTEPDTAGTQEMDSSDAATRRDDDASAGSAPDLTDACVAPTGTQSSPHSIADVIELLNALPKPVSLPCFLSTLAGPLALHATRSLFSAQPTVGMRSPRIFLFFDGLMLSVVPEGKGSRLLEFGELLFGARSLKGELQFPITDTLSAATPFERVLYDDTGTSCGFCHAAEAPAEDVAFTRAYTSQALRPSTGARVGLDVLDSERSACDANAEPDRCAMLQSLFLHGDPIEHEFPDSFALFQ